jgi:1,4-dihydroxy-2-naphthoate polyprenyltransferase
MMGKANSSAADPGADVSGKAPSIPPPIHAPTLHNKAPSIPPPFHPSTLHKKPSSTKIWVLAARPKTLPAAAAPVIVGIALAVEAGLFHALAAACALLGALLIQIGTNYANDYQDFLKGADTAARRGPLRVTQAGLASPEAVRRAAVIAFALAVVAGLYLIYRGGWPILAIGLLSILFGALYTGGRYSLAYLGIADIFVLIFFGPVAVAGTFYVQAVGSGAATTLLPMAILAGLGPGFLATAILLANNIRDVEQDAAVGKRTLVVRLGRGTGIGLYITCFLLAAAVPAALWLWTGGGAWGVLAAIVLPMGIINARVLRRSGEYEVIGPVLGRTAAALLAYSILFSIGWVLG